jgi:hypothetical protein
MGLASFTQITEPHADASRMTESRYGQANKRVQIEVAEYNPRGRHNLRLCQKLDIVEHAPGPLPEPPPDWRVCRNPDGSVNEGAEQQRVQRLLSAVDSKTIETKSGPRRQDPHVFLGSP